MGYRTAAGQQPGEDPVEASPVAAGDLIGGKFRVERLLGQGGMGFVVEATHLQLEERVALKFLRKTAMAMPDVVSRFAQEARAAVRLKSEHVARIIDVGACEDGSPYMVMEYLEGADLGHVIERDGPLRISDAVEYVIQACEGVGEAHARGIVHRDIKPENLFLVTREDGWKLVKVLDFGISKDALIAGKSPELVGHETKSLMGSPYYMSPEQLRSTRTVDHRADIWSMGVVLFELLTGTVPFDPERKFTELVADILETPHRRLRLFRKDVPSELEKVIDRCLEKDRSLRFQNCAELAIALLPFAPRRSRVTAERTTSFTRAAGLLSDPNLQVPPSMVPPAFIDNFESTSRVVRASQATELALPEVRTSPAISSPTFSAAPTTTSATPAPTRARWVAPVAVLAFLTVATIGIVFVVVSARGKPMPSSESAAAAASTGGSTATAISTNPKSSGVADTTPSSSGGRPESSATASANAPTTVTSSSDGTSGAPSSMHGVRGPAIPARSVGPSRAATPPAADSVPRTDGLEIRRER